MKTFVPNYYKDFKCIADKCKHSCCIGWEIDIDDDTLATYNNIKNPFRNRLDDGINRDSENACFKLDGKGRCAFLNENNLCEIILNLGEDSLCQICTDHPRFRNYYSNHTEIGLGLCCEEAGRIILSQKETFSLVELSDDGIDIPSTEEEDDFFDFRKYIFNKIEENESVLTLCDCESPDKTVDQWADIFLSLERLDEHWTILLNELKLTDIENVSIPEEFDNCFKNLLLYFTYRHLNEFSTEKDLMFIYLSCEMIKNLCKMHICKYENITLEDLIEYSRMYSSEIEYSDENIEKLIELL
jgi:lysine-N-methylase